MSQLSLDDAIAPPTPTPHRTAQAPHNGAETSRQAAEAVAKSGQIGRQAREILICLRARETCAEFSENTIEPGDTRKEISKGTGIVESTVGPRVQHLIELGYCREEGERVPPGGSHKQKIVFITEAGRDALRKGQGG